MPTLPQGFRDLTHMIEWDEQRGVLVQNPSWVPLAVDALMNFDHNVNGYANLWNYQRQLSFVLQRKEFHLEEVLTRQRARADHWRSN